MKGYSILEVLIYSAILAAISVLSVGSILSVYKGLSSAAIEARISRNGELVLDRFIRDVRSASSTDTGASVFGIHPGVLQLGSTLIKYSISGTAIARQEGAGSPQNITSANARITNLVFYRDSFSSSDVSSEIIKVEFTMESGEGQFLKSKKFFGSAVLRGKY
ncbi:MAG: hypothetical protein AAB556_01845 [Patescibacteria group bacterium]